MYYTRFCRVRQPIASITCNVLRVCFDLHSHGCVCIYVHVCVCVCVCVDAENRKEAAAAQAAAEQGSAFVEEIALYVSENSNPLCPQPYTLNSKP